MTTQEVKKLIKQSGGNWKNFLTWMYGQTVGLNDKGETDWYDYDVNRFIRYKCNPKNEPIAEWD